MRRSLSLEDSQVCFSTARNIPLPVLHFLRVPSSIGWSYTFYPQQKYTKDFFSKGGMFTAVQKMQRVIKETYKMWANLIRWLIQPSSYSLSPQPPSPTGGCVTKHSGLEILTCVFHLLQSNLYMPPELMKNLKVFTFVLSAAHFIYYFWSRFYPYLDFCFTHHKFLCFIQFL